MIGEADGPGPGFLRPATARAAGKVILLGEHAVVHGQPALAAGVDWGVTVGISPASTRTLVPPASDPRVARVVDEAARLLGIEPERGFTVSLGGDLPIAVGLGSSAALSVALVRALASGIGRELSIAEITAHAHALERVFHGSPSGVDGTAAALGGLLWFEAGPPARSERVIAKSPFDLLVVLSGARHETAKTVGSLRERATAAPEVYQPVFGAIGSLVSHARAAIESGDLPLLGALMTMNHALLRACGVSTSELDATVEAGVEAGALGAKLTGGGGGGAVIALAGRDVDGLAGRLQARGYEVLRTRVGGEAQGLAQDPPIGYSGER